MAVEDPNVVMFDRGSRVDRFVRHIASDTSTKRIFFLGEVLSNGGDFLICDGLISLSESLEAAAKLIGRLAARYCTMLFFELGAVGHEALEQAGFKSFHDGFPKINFIKSFLFPYLWITAKAFG